MSRKLGMAEGCGYGDIVAIRRCNWDLSSHSGETCRLDRKEEMSFVFSERLLRQRYLDITWLPCLFLYVAIFITTKSNLITRWPGLAKE